MPSDDSLSAGSPDRQASSVNTAARNLPTHNEQPRHQFDIQTPRVKLRAMEHCMQRGNPPSGSLGIVQIQPKSKKLNPLGGSPGFFKSNLDVADKQAGSGQSRAPVEDLLPELVRNGCELVLAVVSQSEIRACGEHTELRYPER
jgi:hypothetical protein